MLSPAFYLTALLLSAVSVCWSYVLVQPGMLLAPVQAWVRTWHRRWWLGAHPVTEPGVLALGQHEQVYWNTEGTQLDHRWWWKMLWGCPPCVAGQWGLWGFLLLFPLSAYSLPLHIAFIALTLFLAAGWRAFYAWTQALP